MLRRANPPPRLTASCADAGPTPAGPGDRRSTTRSPRWSCGWRGRTRAGGMCGSRASCSDSATASGPRRSGGSCSATGSHRLRRGTPTPAGGRSRRHQPQLAQRGREQSAQRAEHGAVEPGQCGPGVGAAQHGGFVAQRQDLGVFGGVGAGKQRQPAQHANEHQVDESEVHGERSCWAGKGRDGEGWPAERCWSGPVTRFPALTRSWAGSSTSTRRQPEIP